MKKIVIIIILIMLITLGLAFAGYHVVNNEMKSIQSNLPAYIQIKNGTTSYGLVDNLIENNQLSINPVVFQVWAKLNPDKVAIKTGYYEIDKNSSLLKVFEMFNEGRTKQFSVTLVEGFRIKDWFVQLQSNEFLTQDVNSISPLYEMLVNGNSFCQNVKKSIEGCLLPDTYQFEYRDSLSSILRRAYSAMDNYLLDQWQQRFMDIPIENPYESLILASIIEKETAVASERGVISGVFVNRLHANMRLQTDPTVIYGIGDDFDGNITRKHLRTRTEYNTYRISGLPVTPIAMPSRASIDAALRPQDTEFLYFVSKGDGSHKFSETLEEHQSAVRKYQLGMDN